MPDTETQEAGKIVTNSAGHQLTSQRRRETFDPLLFLLPPARVIRAFYCVPAFGQLKHSVPKFTPARGVVVAFVCGDGLG